MIKSEKIIGSGSIKIFNFPVLVCPECGEKVTRLTDGVKAELYAQDLVKNGNGKQEIDFDVIERHFEGKDIVEVVLG